MAVTRVGQIIRMTANGDTVEGMLQVQALHAPQGIVVKDGAGTTLFTTGSHGMDITLPRSVQVNGLERDSGTGELVVFLA